MRKKNEYKVNNSVSWIESEENGGKKGGEVSTE